MKGMNPEDAPLLLLYDEGVQPLVEQLLDNARTLRAAKKWAQAECALQDALKLCSPDCIDLAIVELYLADFFSDVGEVGEGIKLCRKAYDMLGRQPTFSQRHNEAVALYMLGLLHQQQLLCEPVEALSYYRQALEQFKAAQEYWDKRINGLACMDGVCRLLFVHFDAVELRTLGFDLGVNYEGLRGTKKADKVREFVDCLDRRGKISELIKFGRQMRPALPWDEVVRDDGSLVCDLQMPPDRLRQYYDACEQACASIERRCDQIIERRVGQVWRPAIDVWPPEDTADPFPVDGYGQGCILGSNRVEIGGSTYSSDIAITSGEGCYCFAVPVKSKKLMVPGAQGKDYLLVHQRWRMRDQKEEIKAGVMWSLGEGWFAVDFKREPNGKISFYQRSPRRLTIGEREPAGKIKGYVSAVLKKE